MKVSLSSDESLLGMSVNGKSQSPSPHGHAEFHTRRMCTAIFQLHALSWRLQFVDHDERCGELMQESTRDAEQF